MRGVRHAVASESGAEEKLPPGECPRTCPHLNGQTGNGAVRSSGESPREDQPSGTSTGKGKTGRANESESMKRLRHSSSPERWLTKTVIWVIGQGTPLALTRTPRPRSRMDAHSSRISKMRNVTTLMGVWSRVGKVPYRTVSQRQRRQILQQDRMAQEAKAGSRKAPGMHNRPDRVIPNPKGC